MAKSNHSTVLPIAAPVTALRRSTGSVCLTRTASSLDRMALLLGVELGVRTIGDEHVTRRVADGQRRTRLLHDGLRSDPACPENGHLARCESHWIAEVGGVEVFDAEHRRVPDMY